MCFGPHTDVWACVWVQVPTQVCVPVPVPIQENTFFVIKDSVRRGSWVILTHVREVKTHTLFLVMAINDSWVCTPKIETFFSPEKGSE